METCVSFLFLGDCTKEETGARLIKMTLDLMKTVPFYSFNMWVMRIFTLLMINPVRCKISSQILC